MFFKVALFFTVVGCLLRCSSCNLAMNPGAQSLLRSSESFRRGEDDESLKVRSTLAANLSSEDNVGTGDIVKLKNFSRCIIVQGKNPTTRNHSVT